MKIRSTSGTFPTEPGEYIVYAADGRFPTLTGVFLKNNVLHYRMLDVAMQHIPSYEVVPYWRTNWIWFKCPKQLIK